MKAPLYAMLVVSFCLLTISACSSTPQTPGTTTVSAGCSSASAKSYQIGRGDVLSISVWNNKNLDRVATVRPDGMISFPLINNVRAAGKTPTQLQKTVTQKLKRYVADPEVSVVIQKIHASTASVLGEVNNPGSYDMTQGGTTVLDMLAKAGGFTDFADRGEISVLRKTSDGNTQRIPFRYGQATSQHPGAANLCVQPGDIVIVR